MDPTRNRWLDAAQRPAVALGILALLLATQIRWWWDPIRDGCGYLSIARSMAKGGPVTNLGSPQLHYAPGYPLLISPAFWTSDRPFLLLSIMQWLFIVAFMLGLYAWARRWFPGHELWITALTMANAGLWLFTRSTLSEPAFMAVMMATVLALDRLVASREPGKTAMWCLACAGLVAALSIIRPVGVLIVCGYAIAASSQAWRKQISWKRALATTLGIGLPATLCVMALIRHDSHLAAADGALQRSYASEFKVTGRGLASQLAHGTCLRVSEVGRLLIPNLYKAHPPRRGWLDWKMALFTPLFGALAWAWWRLARDSRNVLLLAFPFYWCLHVLYAYDQATRYMLPMLPVLVACAWHLIGQLSGHRTRLLGGLLAAHLAVAMYSNARSIVLAAPSRQWWTAIDTMNETISRRPGEVLVADVPDGLWETMMLATDRPLSPTSPEAPITDSVSWIVMPAAAPARPDFVERGNFGRFALLERVVQASRSDPAAPRAR